MPPNFSIIVGVYNQRATLPDLIEALQQQTYQPFEIHFCDDGSTDGSVEFIEEYLKKRRGWYLHQQEHKGMRLARNLNQGINAAKGDYCVLIMADSFPESNYLEVLKGYVASHRMVCGIRIQVAPTADSDGKDVGVDIDWRSKKNVIPPVAGVVLGLPWMALTGNGLTIPTEAFRLHGGLLEELEGYGGEDNEIVARLFFKGYVPWSVPDLRLYHHWHKAQKSNFASQLKAGTLIEKYATT